MDLNIIDYIKPELLVLVAVLYIVGIALKKSAVNDRFIPAILGVAGVLLSLIYVIGTTAVNTPQEIALAAFTAITQGVLVAGASVYVNQLIKQTGGK